MKTYKFKINDVKYKAKIEEYKSDYVVVNVNGINYRVDIEREENRAEPKLVRTQKNKPEISISTPVTLRKSQNGVVAPIPGVVVSVKAKEGEVVKIGQSVVILEAMKMESEITTDKSGKVKKIYVKEGDSVQEGKLMVEIEE